jgi:hypothetical protein
VGRGVKVMRRWDFNKCMVGSKALGIGIGIGGCIALYWEIYRGMVSKASFS